MSSRNLVICDPDTEYAARLAAFLNGKRELAFQSKNMYAVPTRYRRQQHRCL